MNILLPDYDCVVEEGASEVKNHVLYLYKMGAFKRAMYRLTYMMFGEDECYYCHRKLRTDPQNQYDTKRFFSKISIDHCYSLNRGGPHITDNMRPACTECNNRKGNMFEAEYAEYLEMMQRTANGGKKGEAERKLFKQKLAEKQALQRCGRIPCIPEEWLSDVDEKYVLVYHQIGQKNSKAYQQIKKSVKTYGCLIYPIIISANGVLLSGCNANLVATCYNVKPPVIITENVIQLGLPQNNSIC